MSAPFHHQKPQNPDLASNGAQNDCIRSEPLLRLARQPMSTRHADSSPQMSGNINVTIPYDQYTQGIICDPSEYLQSANTSTTHCLTRGQSIGLTVRPARLYEITADFSLPKIVSESGFVSLFAVVYVFWIICV